MVLLEKMEKVKDRGLVVKLADGVDDHEQSSLFLRSLDMLSRYHQSQKPLARIIDFRILPWGVSGEGTVVFPVALDYLVWTGDNAGIVEGVQQRFREDPAFREFEFWVSGAVSPRTKSELEARGWSVHQKAFEILK